MNTGDKIKHIPTGITYDVACVHDHWLHTLGYPEQRLQVSDCTVVWHATAADRAEVIAALAASSGNGHRPQCAREQLARNA